MTREQQRFDRESTTWDDNPVRVKLAEDVATAMAAEAALSPDMDVLDFGCGTGLLTLRIQPHVHTIDGVDNSRGMLEVFEAKIARQHLHNVRARFFDMEEPASVADRYHLVVSSMALHHVACVEAALRLFHGWLHPGGRLCIADLDSDGGLFHENGEGVFHPGFDRAALRGAFIDAGFDAVRDRNAAEIVKPIHGGEMRAFGVFLMTGTKRS